MYSKTIKYTDYNGVEREEEFLFNLSKAELMEMQLSAEGGLENNIKSIIQTRDTKKIIELFKKIIIDSYGIKSADGIRFVKTPELRNDFMQSEAYSELFMELAMDDKAAAEFVNGILPKGLTSEVSKATDNVKELKSV